jgi:hypothetical protein
MEGDSAGPFKFTHGTLLVMVGYNNYQLPRTAPWGDWLERMVRESKLPVSAISRQVYELHVFEPRRRNLDPESIPYGSDEIWEHVWTFSDSLKRTEKSGPVVRDEPASLESYLGTYSASSTKGSQNGKPENAHSEEPSGAEQMREWSDAEWEFAEKMGLT